MPRKATTALTALLVLAPPQSFWRIPIRPPEIKLCRLSEAAEAHRLSESRHFRGKLVFQVR
jgi:hypothetical protein